MEDGMDFKDALKRARENLRMSHEEMGRQLGISGTAERKWESGENFPTIKRWARIQAITGVDPSLYVENNNETVTQKIGTVTYGNITNGATATISQHTVKDLDISAEEKELLLLFRRFGNAAMLDRCRRQLLKMEELSR
jgi:transcriptional regulator with XRE-family HTH domain